MIFTNNCLYIFSLDKILETTYLPTVISVKNIEEIISPTIPETQFTLILNKPVAQQFELHIFAPNRDKL